MVAYFNIAKSDGGERRKGVQINQLTTRKTIYLFHALDLKVMHGDELRLRYVGDVNKPWTGVGHVVKIPDNFGEEVGLEMKTNQKIPFDCVNNFVVDFIWKSTSFDRYLFLSSVD